MIKSDNLEDEAVSCLIISFARPESLSRIINECLLSPARRVYLFVDLAKDSFVKENREVINLALSYAEYRNFHVKIAAISHGPQAGVAAGMDWAFGYENELLIIEDDTIVNPSTFRFFDSARSLLGKTVGVVCSLSPYAIDDLGVPNCHRSHLSPFALTNCWMLDKHLWLHSTKSLSALWVFRILRYKPKFYASYLFFLSGALRFDGRLGKTGWDSKMQFSLLDLNLKSLMPNTNLSGNSGNDHVASNPNRLTENLDILWEIGTESPELRICDSVVCERTILKAFKSYFGISWRSYVSPIKTLILTTTARLLYRFAR